jgi:hypothetical protein
LLAVIGTGLTGALAAKQAFDPKLTELIHMLDQGGGGAAREAPVLDALKGYRLSGYAGVVAIAAGLALFVASFTKRSALIWGLAGACVLIGAIAIVGAGGAKALGIGDFSPREHALTYAIPLAVAAVFAALAELCRLRIALRAA